MDLAFMEDFFLCSLKMWRHHLAAPKSAMSTFRKLWRPNYLPWCNGSVVLCTVPLPYVSFLVSRVSSWQTSLISHLEQEEELRMEERNLNGCFSRWVSTRHTDVIWLSALQWLEWREYIVAVLFLLENQLEHYLVHLCINSGTWCHHPGTSYII